MAEIQSDADGRILLLGKNGQVGWELQQALSPLGKLIALDQEELDLTQPDQIRKQVRANRPHLIVNAAAYTAVDRAEDEPDLAMAINGEAPRVLAEEANRLNATLIHYSTDYVFGDNPDPPQNGYTEESEPRPLNVYGRTKWAGDRAISAVAQSYLIFRTSWVYGSRGHNFLLTILKLAREREELTIVDDQVGAPTWSRTLANITAQIVAQSPVLKEASGIYHMASSGWTTWYRFAQAILAGGSPPDCRLKRLIPIASADYPTRAQRPLFSLLDCGKIRRVFGVELPSWEAALTQVLDAVQEKT